MDESFRRQRSMGTLLKPTLQIGKNGLTEQVIRNIRAELMKERIVKIKLHPSFVEGKDKKVLAHVIVEKTDARLIQLIGFTLVLARK